MAGHRIQVPKGTTIKDGRIKLPAAYYKDASAAIRAKKSKRVRVVKKGKP